MKKILLVGLIAITNFLNIYAENNRELSQDTVKSYYLNEVVISTSTKETNDVRTLPGSVSLITPQMIEGQKIISIKNLSAVIPNFFIADYGSKLSTPVYIRGIGERSTGQSIGMYVDNMPYLDKSVFDFEFMDIQRIEVLRGPQGTLYGRNAMSGIVNIFTHSPIDLERTKISLTGGNYGLFRAKGTISQPLSKSTGLSISAYYDRNDGYFINDFSGNRADKLESTGVRLRFDWKLNQNWTAQLIANYDYADQGAFPYGEYKDGNISNPNLDFPGSYVRNVAGSNLNLQYKNDKIIFNSSTGFLYFDDDMKMDIDYGPTNTFYINQLQNERSWTEELTVKSNSNSNYQWSFGAFGFYNDLKTDVLTTMGSDGIRTILQEMFDGIKESNPRAPQITVKNDKIPIPGLFKTPTYGGAIFHQSTYNNLFVDGLSVTAGVRLDYEKTELDYNTNIGMDLDVVMAPGRPGMEMHADTTVAGKESMSFTEVLPKVAVKYEFNKNHYIYATVANGYKTGGYNIQSFADIAQSAIRAKYVSTEKPIVVKDAVSYKPEYSWNYEIGYKGELIKDFLYTELAAFYIDVKDMQITDFVDSGHGRILKNAGKAKSIGFDLGLTAIFTDELRMITNYGFTHATFSDYKVKDANGAIIADYTDNHIPFAPGNTLSVSAIYNKRFQNKWIDRFNIQAQYNAAGKIYWTEENNVSQNFYGTLNMKAGVSKGIFEVSAWTNNTLNTDYTAFYFETTSYNLAQKGRPFTFGIDVNILF